MTLFEELKEKIHSKTDSNFHLKCLDLTTKIWIQELCDLIDEKMGGWISVEKSLPAQGHDVLMNIIDYKVTVGRRYERWQESTGSSWYDNKRISHWMPLPEPPDKIVEDEKAKCILDGKCSIQIDGSGCDFCIANDHNRT